MAKTHLRYRSRAPDRRCRSAALQRVRGAYRRPFVLVAQLLFSQVPKFSFSTFGPTGLLPKLIRSRVDFLFAGFSHDVFSELSTAHLQACRRLTGGLARPAWRPGLSDSSPHEAVSSSPRLPHLISRRANNDANLGRNASRDRRLIFKSSSPANGSRECAPDDRLRRVTQYSRDANNQTDKPRRTGSSGQAGR
ncbi:hypothetical protein V1293_007245 [Bradyrhizobium sp. AZCC 1693]